MVVSRPVYCLLLFPTSLPWEFSPLLVSHYRWLWEQHPGGGLTCFLELGCRPNTWSREEIPLSLHRPWQRFMRKCFSTGKTWVGFQLRKGRNRSRENLGKSSTLEASRNFQILTPFSDFSFFPESSKKAPGPTTGSSIQTRCTHKERNLSHGLIIAKSPLRQYENIHNNTIWE